MSEIISQAEGLFCYPAQFPAKGRLPTEASLVGKNCHPQESYERAYRQELCLAANRRVEPPCCNTLHISLFFDGTGNNLNNDLYLSDPKHPTNIARLFRATIGILPEIKGKRMAIIKMMTAFCYHKLRYMTCMQSRLQQGHL